MRPEGPVRFRLPPSAIRDLVDESRINEIFEEFRAQVSRKTELSVDATVDATARAAAFVPVYEPQPDNLEYLALIEQLSDRDHLASYANSILDGIQSAGIPVERTYFRSVASRTLVDSRGAFRYLDSLLAEFPGHGILIFGSGDSLLDPVTGEPTSDTLLFERWPVRALFSPLPFAEWGYREWILGERGLAVVPMGLTGLSTFHDIMVSPGNSAAVEYTHRDDMLRTPYPYEFRYWSERWAVGEGLNQDTISMIIQRSQEYLGEQCFVWMKACAVYPEVHWGLTLWLGHQVGKSNDWDVVNNDNLVAISRLPWFRYGIMPERLRMEFVSRMSTKERKWALRAIQEAFLGSDQSITRRSSLELNRRTFFLGPILRKLNALFSRGISQDYVLISTISGHRPRLWVSKLPKIIRNVLVKRNFFVSEAIIVAVLIFTIGMWKIFV